MEVEVVWGGRGMLVVAGVLIPVWVGLVQPAESAQSIRVAKANEIGVHFMNSPLIFLYF
jgi:hypothetical protein